MLVELNFNNYKDVEVGTRIIYDNSVGVIKYDLEYTDSLRVGGRSLKNILEECEQVYWIKEN